MNYPQKLNLKINEEFVGVNGIYSPKSQKKE